MASCSTSPLAVPEPVVTSTPDSGVSLRPPSTADLNEFVALTRGSRRFHAGWVAPPRDEAQYLEYLARNEGGDFEARLIARSSDDAIVGAVNVSQIFYGSFRSAYLGYWIGAPYARRGYMGRALPLALTHAFATLRLNRVEANLQPTNAPSRRLVQQLGFRLEGYSPNYLKIGGRWRDHERWALLRGDWSSRRQRAAAPDPGSQGTRGEP